MDRIQCHGVRGSRRLFGNPLNLFFFSVAALGLGGCVIAPSGQLPERMQQPRAETSWRTASTEAAAAPRPSRWRTSSTSSNPQIYPGTEHQKVGRPYQINGIWYYPARQDNYRETGVASWYGAKFHGRPTANGEIYDMNRLTAAHTTLPIPSLVRVTNIENGRQLVLRVNDRGPFAHNRIIDVSRAAAEQLGFKQEGTAKVRVQYLGPAAPAGASASAKRRHAAAPSRPVSRADGGLYVQAAAFRDSDRAAQSAQNLASAGPAVLERLSRAGEEWSRVLLGPWREFEDAEAARAAAARAGYEDARLVRR